MREPAPQWLRIDWKGVLSWRTVLWAMLWLNIDADYDRWRNVQGVAGYLHGIRSLCAFAAAIGACLLARSRAQQAAFSRSGPVRLMAVYGIVACAASVFSASPFGALYWGGLYLSVFIVLEVLVTRGDPLARSAEIIASSCFVAAALAAFLAIEGWEVFFGQGNWFASDQEVINVIPHVRGFTMSRSTGIGRLAAVPALLGLVLLFRAKGPGRLLGGIVACLSILLLLATRARTPAIGVAVACLFMLLAHRARGMAFFVVGVAILAALGSDTVQEMIEKVLYRRGAGEDLTRLTGRTSAWQAGWEVLLNSNALLLGLGPLADRFHMHWGHVHSTWFLALMQAGLVGACIFIASWVAGWRLLLRSLRKLDVLPAEHQILLIGAGTVLAFFTVRSIPESTAAAFSVDMLVVVPCLAYLEILDRRLGNAGVLPSGVRPGIGRAPLAACTVARATRPRPRAVLSPSQTLSHTASGRGPAPSTVGTLGVGDERAPGSASGSGQPSRRHP